MFVAQEAVKADSGGDDSATQPKRKRGRPKGSTKKKSAPAKPKAKSGTGNSVVVNVKIVFQ